VWSLITLFTIPLAIGVIRQSLQYHKTEMYTPAMTKAIALTSVTGILLILGYVIRF
jgi:1,4-dihydroxy-2-naphthoate octaprenyltransferase